MAIHIHPSVTHHKKKSWAQIMAEIHKATGMQVRASKGKLTLEKEK